MPDCEVGRRKVLSGQRIASKDGDPCHASRMAAGLACWDAGDNRSGRCRPSR